MKAKDLNLHPYTKTDTFGRLIQPVKYGYAERPGGSFVIEPIFDMAYEFYDDIAPGSGALAIVEVDHKAGIIYPDGTYFIEPKFYRIRHFHEGFAVVAINRKNYEDWGIIKLDGSYLVPPMFERIDDFKNGYAKAWGCIGVQGFIQPDGSYLLKRIEDIVRNDVKKDSDFEDVNIMGISLDRGVGYIDTDGHWHDEIPQ